MAAKYTRKPHNVLPKFNFQFSIDFLIVTINTFSVHTSISLLASVYNQLL